MPRKIALVETVKKHLPGYAPEIIFDVGANVGATSVAFSAGFPDATIYAFEPVDTTFRKLTKRVADLPNIRPFNVALGRKSGSAKMQIKALSVSNRISGWRDLLKPGETVKMSSGDAFCVEHKLGRVGILKVDAEGHDLEVLRGFARMLKDARIDLVEAEVGMNPENRRHVPFEAVKRHLEGFGYRLFLIYEQQRETPFTGRAMLRRCNVVFGSRKLFDAAQTGAASR
jgi:FkbM family methyltransferase